MEIIKSKRNPLLEAIRGIACILVVFCHFPVEGVIGTYIIAIARFAVPFFLILSGYYSYRIMPEDNIRYAKKKLISVTQITLIGTIVCVVSNSYISFLQGRPIFQWFLDIIGIKTILKFLVFNRAYWLSSVMYYLYMMIYIYALYIVINKFNILDRVYFIVPILLIINVIACKFVNNWYYVGNFALTGFPFFMLGNYLKKNRLVKMEKWLNIALIACGIVITVIENYFYSECYCFIGTLFLSTGLFLLGINNSIANVPSIISNFGTKYSMLIFLLHCPVGYIFRQYENMLGYEFGNLMPFAVIIGTMIISVIIVFIKNTIKEKYYGSALFNNILS